MTIPARTGQPTPDDFDELLSLVWKEPSIFLASPKTIAAFGRECTRRGVPPVIKEIFGSQFISWRGIPIIPCDKLGFNQNSIYKSFPTTDVLLMRLGEDEQGVVGLHKLDTNNGNSNNIPSLTVRYMNTDDHSIANYLLSKYFGVAALVPDAIAKLENVETGYYYEYE